MKRAVLTFAVVVSVVVSTAAAQRIETETSDRTRIVHLKTELNHLTVIEVSEPVVQVAAGSPAFKIEWRENKVFVQPTEAEAATNLFIWTASQRLNYELEPAGSVATMDFAVDQTPVRVTPIKLASVTPPPPAPSITDLLLQGKPVRLPPGKQRTSKPVEVWISDLYENDGRLLIRYRVTNHGTKPYAIHTPDVYQMDGVRSPQSLYGLVNSQLGEEQVAKLKIRQQVPVTVVDGKLQSQQIAPGEEAVGVVSLAIMPSAQPRILRLQFPSPKSSDEESSSGQKTQIAAFLVR